MLKRGPLPSSIQPSRQKYKCPVKDCKNEIRGDDIPKHFRKCANLMALDKALENYSILKKCEKEGDIIKDSEKYLNDILLQASESEKNHTLYLFQHDHSSIKLPTYNSSQFKCQLKSTDSLPDAFKNCGFSVLTKKPKLVAEQTDQSEEISNETVQNQETDSEILENVPELSSQSQNIQEIEKSNFVDNLASPGFIDILGMDSNKRLTVTIFDHSPQITIILDNFS